MVELGDPIGFWAAIPCRWARLVEAPPPCLAPEHAEAFRRNSSPITMTSCRIVRQKTQRGSRRAIGSQNLNPGLRAKHPLLIGSQDQRLLAGHVVRLGADVTFSIEEQHPQQLTCGIKQVHRDDANRAVTLRRLANGLERQGKEGGGHGCAGERPCRCAPEKPAARKGRAATCVSPCALLLPGQTKGSARQPHGPPPLSTALAPPLASSEPLVTSDQSVPGDTAECTLRWPW